METAWRHAHKFMLNRAKNTCIPEETAPLLTLREMAQFLNISVRRLEDGNSQKTRSR
jgi:hypothetical protein